MREAYKEYVKEHPEELRAVMAVIRRSDAFEIARQRRIEEKLALIQRCREVLENETRNKRS